MRIGIGKETINPSLPVFLSGLPNRKMATIINDSLYVRVIIAEVEKERYGIISYDLIGVDHMILDKLTKVMNYCGLNINNFIVSATHTHTAPGGVLDVENGILKGSEYIFMPVNGEYIDYVINNTKKALHYALENIVETNMATGKGDLYGVSTNRNDITLPGNNELYVTYLTQKNGKKIAIVNFACHPTIMNLADPVISADFPGSLEAYLSDAGFYMTVFLNGSAGDISTRFIRNESSIKEVKRIGKIMSEKVLEIYKTSSIVSSNLNVHKDSMIVQLELKENESIKEAQKLLEIFEANVKESKRIGVSKDILRKAESKYEGALANYNRSLKLESRRDPYKLVINVFLINGEYFVCFPGELYSELSNRIQSEYENVHFICYCNGHIGYLSDTVSFNLQYYEALSSPFKKNEAEKLMDKLSEFLLNMSETNSQLVKR